MLMKRLLFSIALLCAATFTVHAASEPKYNLITILTDDQAVWTIGAYGGPAGVTPNLDRLAAEGARFTNAFVATPVCSPSRATYLTGRHGTQLGIVDWISDEEAEGGLGLSDGIVTWPQLLQQAGWKTALVGKWHLGTQAQFHPTRRGYDHFFGFLGPGTAAMAPVFDLPSGRTKLSGCSADLITDDALKFITENRGKPFLIDLHFREPHEPYGPMPKVDQDAIAALPIQVPDLAALNHAKVERDTRSYLAAVHAIDRNVGRLVEALKQQGLWERTILLFTSDHGYSIGQHLVEGKGNAHWIAGGVRGPRRPNLWDLSLRVPLLVRWPGVTKPGMVVPQMVSNLDFYPTLLTMLGVRVPDDFKRDGMNVAPLLRGEASPGREMLFFQYDLHNTASARLRGVRTERWKYVRRFDAARLDELYDLQVDPGELNNLLPGNPTLPITPEIAKTRRNLDERLQTWMRSIDDPLLR